MKRQFIYICFSLFMAFGACAQNKNVVTFSQTINKDNAFKHLSVLASDEFEGRETGKRGAWKAAEYIKSFFSNIGLKGPIKGDFFQSIDLSAYAISQVMSINGQPLEALTDFYTVPQTVGVDGLSINTNSILFLGYGQDRPGYNDFSGQSLAGKVVMIIKSNDPADRRGFIRINKNSNSGLNAKLKYLTEQKVAGILVIDPMTDNLPPEMKRYLSSEQLLLKTAENLEELKRPSGLPVITIGTNAANQILLAAKTNLAAVEKKMADSGMPASQELDVVVTACAKKTETSLKASNVLGFLEGSDPKLKKEVLVITAHYDHIGIDSTIAGADKINNGADDDGSGTTGVLMIAEAFAKAKKAGKGPKRSILFMTVVGEEKGLLGSEWYSEHPVFPLDNTIANLNIDMIGRGDKDHANDNNFVYIIGSDMLSSDLDRIGKKANKDYVNLKLDERYNNRTDPNRFYYRSDHYNFAKHGIPVIFYFNGVHDDYHQPGDEISKIDFPMLAKRAKLVYFTAWELANAAKRPIVDKNEDGTLKK